MRKSYRMTMILLSAALLCGCSSFGKEKVPVMDFQEKVEWKAPDPAAGKKPRILFVGNSHTFYNNLSGMFVNIIDNLGHKGDVHELSSGYYSLRQFADTADRGGAVLDQTLSDQKWDFVILQENTSNALSSVAEKEMFPFARTLDEKIKASGAQTIFLMTWTPKDGIKKMKREEAQSDIASCYMTIADELGSLLIPAGAGFLRCSQLYPEIELWNQDGQHPSPEGSYLAACLAYAVIYQESPEDCSYTGDLDQDVARKLQGIAADMIFTD